MGVITLISAILKGALSQIAGGQSLPTEDDDRMICHGNQEQSRCSRLVSYIHKKLFLDGWFMLFDSVKLSRIFHVQQ